MSDQHVSRNWTRDPFAPKCGCTLLECGHVSLAEAVRKRCEQHDPIAARTIRSQHQAGPCDQDFARTVIPDEPEYVGNERDILGEDDGAYIFAPREGSPDWWERFDRTKPNHMAAMERTRATGRIAFLELESGDPS